jgi:manganese transport protein
VAAVSGRATFELIRERLGPLVAVLNLGASFMINLMTLTAEIGGVALALQLVSSVSYLLWVPFALLQSGSSSGASSSRSWRMSRALLGSS